MGGVKNELKRILKFLTWILKLNMTPIIKIKRSRVFCRL